MLYQKYNDNASFSCYIIGRKKKADESVHRKDGIQMNTNMILSYLKHERYEALDSKQGLVSACTFLIERNRMNFLNPDMDERSI